MGCGAPRRKDRKGRVSPGPEQYAARENTGRRKGRAEGMSPAVRERGIALKEEYTRAELGSLLDALGQVFSNVRLADAASGALLDPETLEVREGYVQVPPLDGEGRGWIPGSAGKLEVVLYRAANVEGRPCMVVMDCQMPDNQPVENREANALRRQLAQYQEELSRDYVTGAYNRRYLTEYWLPSMAGRSLCAVLVRVNEYAQTCSEFGRDAGDNCLNAAAGVLQQAVGIDTQKAILVRLEDGVFLLAADCPGSQMERRLREILNESRRVFNISLSRRAEYTLAVACADWAEAGSWDLMLSLAEQRLTNA